MWRKKVISTESEWATIEAWIWPGPNEDINSSAESLRAACAFECV